MAGDEKTEVPRDSAGRRVDKVFGDVLPETTADERDLEPACSDGDSWYLENRPPHHDR